MFNQIQSLSLDVPAGCPNNCFYCVAKMHANDYANNLNYDGEYFDVYFNDYVSRLRYVQKTGCQSVIFTGKGEALFNKRYLFNFALINNHILETPFEILELQTSGVALEKNLRFLRNTVKLSTISLSLSDIFDSEHNAYIAQTPADLRFDIDDLCKKIIDYGFTLRLSLNMNDSYNHQSPEEIFLRAKELGAHQVTIRVLYESPSGNTEQDAWIRKHRCPEYYINNIHQYIVDHGTKLGVLPFGATKYSVHEMSVVLDDDCMSTKTEEVVKYAILRPDCQLYTRWDDKGSRL